MTVEVHHDVAELAQHLGTDILERVDVVADLVRRRTGAVEQLVHHFDEPVDARRQALLDGSEVVLGAAQHLADEGVGLAQPLEQRGGVGPQHSMRFENLGDRRDSDLLRLLDRALRRLVEFLHPLRDRRDRFLHRLTRDLLQFLRALRQVGDGLCDRDPRRVAQLLHLLRQHGGRLRHRCARSLLQVVRPIGEGGGRLAGGRARGLVQLLNRLREGGGRLGQRCVGRLPPIIHALGQRCRGFGDGAARSVLQLFEVAIDGIGRRDARLGDRAGQFGAVVHHRLGKDKSLRFDGLHRLVGDARHAVGELASLDDEGVDQAVALLVEDLIELGAAPLDRGDEVVGLADEIASDLDAQFAQAVLDLRHVPLQRTGGIGRSRRQRLFDRGRVLPEQIADARG